MAHAQRSLPTTTRCFHGLTPPSFIYWNANEHVMLKFYGTAHVLDDVADRDTVFLGSPENERAADPDRNGTAVEVELHLISGFLDGAPYRQD